MKKIFFMFAALAAFAACGDKEGDGPIEPPVVEPVLTVSVESLTFAAEGESKTFTVTANNDWTVTGADWLTVTPRSGAAADNKTVTVSADANETGEARTATVVVKSATLTKNVTVSQEPVPAEEPTPENPTPENPAPGSSASYQRSTDPVMYAAGLQDGKKYVMYCRAYDLSTDAPMCWSESNGKLTMKELNSVVYTAAEVFEFKYDASKSCQPYDNYGSYSAGAWKSVSTGKYLDAEFNLNAELSGAVWLEYANNWNNMGGSEINVLDVYKYPYTDGVQTIWYKGGTSFEWANNANPEGFTHLNRKWVAYEVSELAQ